MTPPRFDPADLDTALPAPDIYGSTVADARFTRSRSGNPMIVVEHALLGVPPLHERLTEFFVLEGASPRGIAWARHRLVELYRACGLSPEPGDPIRPAVLVGARLRVEIAHETWRGEPRLRVVRHAPWSAGAYVATAVRA